MCQLISHDTQSGFTCRLRLARNMDCDMRLSIDTVRLVFQDGLEHKVDPFSRATLRK